MPGDNLNSENCTFCCFQIGVCFFEQPVSVSCGKPELILGGKCQNLFDAALRWEVVPLRSSRGACKPSGNV